MEFASRVHHSKSQLVHWINRIVKQVNSCPRTLIEILGSKPTDDCVREIQLGFSIVNYTSYFKKRWKKESGEGW